MPFGRVLLEDLSELRLKNWRAVLKMTGYARSFVGPENSAIFAPGIRASR